MHYRTTRTTKADAQHLWSVVSDVTRWPELIEVYEELTPAGPGPLAVGATAHVKQAGLAAGDWTVTELVEGSHFTWESHQPGIRLSGATGSRPTPTGSPG